MQTLICLNTCKRAIAVKAIIWSYVEFVKSRDDFFLVVGLDGDDSETVSYCKEFGIPLVYSDENEGVGLSKNRVLSTFGDFDYYFFIEDDVELLNPKVFDAHIEVSKKSGIHHFSSFERKRIIDEVARTEVGGYTIIHSMFGGAPFNFFTKEGLETVGGWHDMFATYKRFGHTEHTYRFVNAGLSKYPFNVIDELIEGYLGWNDPISVTKIKVQTTANRVFQGESDLMDEKLSYYPVKTLSPYHLTKDLDKSGFKKDSFAFVHRCRFKLQMWGLNTLRQIKRAIVAR
ncbi:MAG TPA: hypothetical protein PLV58_04585 [Campylobacterales bacterium]|nr:hypothetical protein [Campylobacterales bacterium]